MKKYISEDAILYFISLFAIPFITFVLPYITAGHNLVTVQIVAIILLSVNAFITGIVLAYVRGKRVKFGTLMGGRFKISLEPKIQALNYIIIVISLMISVLIIYYGELANESFELYQIIIILLLIFIIMFIVWSILSYMVQKNKKTR